LDARQVRQQAVPWPHSRHCCNAPVSHEVLHLQCTTHRSSWWSVATCSSLPVCCPRHCTWCGLTTLYDDSLAQTRAQWGRPRYEITGVHMPASCPPPPQPCLGCCCVAAYHTPACRPVPWYWAKATQCLWLCSTKGLSLRLMWWCHVGHWPPPAVPLSIPPAGFNGMQACFESPLLPSFQTPCNGTNSWH
jgi:hypothetical protein